MYAYLCLYICSLLNTKLEQKADELAKFEAMVGESIAVQRKMKDQLAAQNLDLESAKNELQNARHQLSIQTHELATAQSARTVLESADKSRHLDLINQLADLKKQLQVKTSISDEAMHVKQELTRQLEEERVSNRAHLRTVTEQLQYALC